MPYYPHLDDRLRTLKEWFDLAHEQGADVAPLVAEFDRTLDAFAARAAALPVDPTLAQEEPNALEAILALRPDGPRTLPLPVGEATLRDRLHGAWMGRAAGCTLGIPCEGLSREDIRQVCYALGVRYPLADYWPVDPNPRGALLECNGLPRRFLLKPDLHCVMPDDDLLYTLLGLLILEEYGLEFSSEDVADAWLRYVPFACTAEAAALANLRAGLRPPQTALWNNPDCEWLGADIRADPWGYAAPGLLSLAARYAYTDARVSHVRNGIYGAMYFAAVISAALVTGDIRHAVELGLTEIPRNCRLASALRQTLLWVDENDGYDRVLDRIFAEHRGMHVGHTINCACVTVAGLLYGREDFENIITLVVMGGLDTDCTGATAGSIAGAALGFCALPDKWTRPLGNTVRTYLNGRYRFFSDDIVDRFLCLALENRRRYTSAMPGERGDR